MFILTLTLTLTLTEVQFCEVLTYQKYALVAKGKEKLQKYVLKHCDMSFGAINAIKITAHGGTRSPTNVCVLMRLA